MSKNTFKTHRTSIQNNDVCEPKKKIKGGGELQNYLSISTFASSQAVSQNPGGFLIFSQKFSHYVTVHSGSR